MGEKARGDFGASVERLGARGVLAALCAFALLRAAAPLIVWGVMSGDGGFFWRLIIFVPTVAP